MALTGGRITASIYRINDNDLIFGSAVTGRLNNFGIVGTIFYPAPLGTTAGPTSITMNSIIEVLPTGLRTNSTKYYTDATVAQLVSNGS